ncbi:hypothetical protein D3C86_2082590 [compost metagenome]
MQTADSDLLTPADASSLTKDPLTVGVFFIIVSYYVLYFGYLIREEKKLRSSTSDPIQIAD